MEPTEVHYHRDSGSGVGIIVSIAILALVIFLMFYYGLPLLRGAGTQVNIPDKINVNVNSGQK